MKPVDMIVHHARIYTVDEGFSTAESFAVRDGKFIAVGTNEDILNHYSADQVIDANGQFIYPGFIDAHCHFYSYGLDLEQYVDLTETSSFQEVINRVIKFDKTRTTAWILGRGWDQNKWEINEFPDNHELNKIFPDVPVMLIRVDGHAVIVNNAALKLANITTDTKVNGGEIILKNGIITGLLIDNAVDLVKAKIPKPSEQTKIRALEIAQSNCFAAGLCSVTDAGLEKSTVELIDSLQKAGILQMRINAMLTPSDENIETYVKKGIYKTDHLNVRSLKLYADGALGSRGAKLIEPYSDVPGYNGLMIEKPEYYDRMCSIAYKYGYQVNTHAIGDSANRFILNTYGKFLKGKNDRRWRVEHAQVVDSSDFALFGKYSIIPSVQATHATSDMYWAGKRLGNKRLRNAYAYRKLMEQNGWIINGTDFPVENISPIYTFYAAVSRKDLKGYPAGGFQPENAISRKDALRSITSWAAKGAFEENEKGSITPGKLADFVITDKDLMTVSEPEIPKIRIISTFSSGKQVYNRQ
ncbi:MAG: amidohydrolase [Bacteroidia bacterium]|nr:amidohydrolase [Bacteroidia bacterium]